MSSNNKFVMFVSFVVNKKYLLLLLLLIANCSLLIAQTVQMSWQGGEYALHYEIEIERETDNVFMPYLTESTTEKILWVSLPPGNYCYRIIPYDILERPGTATEWIYFEIKEFEEDPSQRRKDAERNFYINIGAAYMPVIPVFGKDNETAPYGASLRASVNFPVLQNLGFANTFIGPELFCTASVYDTWNEAEVTCGLNLRLYMNILNEKIGIVYRAGVEYIIELDNDVQNPFNFITGISFIYQITNTVNMEAGVDFASTISDRGNGSIKPWIGAGVRF